VPRNAVNPYVTQSHLSSAKRLVRKGLGCARIRVPHEPLISKWSRINVLPVRLDTWALALDTLVWSQVVKGLSRQRLDQIWLTSQNDSPFGSVRPILEIKGPCDAWLLKLEKLNVIRLKVMCNRLQPDKPITRVRRIHSSRLPPPTDDEVSIVTP